MTWENVDSSTWSMLELASGCVCANLVTLRPLVKLVFPSLGSSWDKTGASGGSSEKASGGSRSWLFPARWMRRNIGGSSTNGSSKSGHDADALEKSGSDGSSPKALTSDQAWTHYPGKGRYGVTATAGNGMGFPSEDHGREGGKPKKPKMGRDLEKGSSGSRL